MQDLNWGNQTYYLIVLTLSHGGNDDGNYIPMQSPSLSENSKSTTPPDTFIVMVSSFLQ